MLNLPQNPGYFPNINNVSPFDVSMILDKMAIAVRSGTIVRNR